MKTSELTGVALDWAVAKCEGNTFAGDYPHLLASRFRPPRYSTDWAQAGPIIEREMIATSRGGSYTENFWMASRGFSGEHIYGPTPLIAAMRCFVASKLGNTVNIPDELAMLGDEACKS